MATNSIDLDYIPVTEHKNNLQYIYLLNVCNLIHYWFKNPIIGYIHIHWVPRIQFM